MKRQLGVLVLLFFVAIAFSGVATAACCHKDKCADDDKDKCKCSDDKDKCKCDDNKCSDDDDDHDHGHWWHPPWW